MLKADKQWKWTKTEATAFQNSQLLVHFDPDKKLILSCDASAYGIGAVLAHQSADLLEQSIGFISRTLSPAELLPIRKKRISTRFWTGHRSQAITKSTK